MDAGGCGARGTRRARRPSRPRSVRGCEGGDRKCDGAAVLGARAARAGGAVPAAAAAPRRRARLRGVVSIPGGRRGLWTGRLRAKERVLRPRRGPLARCRTRARVMERCVPWGRRGLRKKAGARGGETLRPRRPPLARCRARLRVCQAMRMSLWTSRAPEGDGSARWRQAAPAAAVDCPLPYAVSGFSRMSSLWTSRDLERGGGARVRKRWPCGTRRCPAAVISCGIVMYSCRVGAAGF